MEIEGGAPKRFWAKHKVQVVLRLLRGEDIDLVSRDIGVTAATLTHLPGGRRSRLEAASGQGIR